MINYDLKKLIGKTIKNITDEYYDGVLIEFTDKTKFCLRTTEFPEGGYNSVILDEIKESPKEQLKESIICENNKNNMKEKL